MVNKQDGEPWPVGRSAHAACCLGYGSKCPCVLIVSGVDKDDKTLKDAWLFEVSTRRWTEVSYVYVAKYNTMNKRFGNHYTWQNSS